MHICLFILFHFQIQFDGKECHSPNYSYYIGFSTVFFLLAFVCFVQLVMCIISEWQRMKAPSLLRACRVTTQKLLYFLTFLASIIRGAYFTSPVSALPAKLLLVIIFLYVFSFVITSILYRMQLKMGLRTV